LTAVRLHRHGAGLSRRQVLHTLAGGACAAVAGLSAQAAPSRISRLIAETRDIPDISHRIAAVSRALLGTRYRGYTLIGGPKQPEQMVTRDDGFDCVTFCETVLAAAIARTPEQFEPVLQRIRYRNGIVNWFERNHAYHDWSVRNVANKTCRVIAMPDEIVINKTILMQRALGKQKISMTVVPRASLLAHKDRLATGDLIGFVSRRLWLDYFHTGFVVFGGKGEFLLRHASESHRRVLDQPMEQFLRVNRVQNVTLLRPLEPAAESSAK
jgi:hypothetical protein